MPRTSNSQNGRKTLAILWLEKDGERHMASLEHQFASYLNSRQLAQPDFKLTNPSDAEVASFLSEAPNRVIIAFSDTPPDWRKWIDDELIASGLHSIFLWNLPDQKKEQAAWKYNQSAIAIIKRFIAGNFVGKVAPYGLNIASSKTKRRILVRGRPVEADIVRLIFNLYSEQNKSRTEILHLLRAQQVPAPSGKKIWSTRLLDNLLSDPFYIGTNCHAALRIPDVFEPLVDPAIFHAVQICLLSDRSIKLEKLFHDTDGASSQAIKLNPDYETPDTKSEESVHDDEHDRN